MRSTTYPSRLARAALCLAAASLTACTTTTGASVTTSSLRAGPTTGHERIRDRLEVTEIQTARAQSALELVRTLRPEFLRADPTSRSALGGAAGRRAAPVVYVDGNKWGGPDVLSSIPAHLVAEIRRLPATEARMRYGLVDPIPVLDVRLLQRK